MRWDWWCDTGARWHHYCVEKQSQWVLPPVCKEPTPCSQAIGAAAPEARRAERRAALGLNCVPLWRPYVAQGRLTRCHRLWFYLLASSTCSGLLRLRFFARPVGERVSGHPWLCNHVPFRGPSRQAGSDISRLTCRACRPEGRSSGDGDVESRSCSWAFNLKPIL